MKNCLMFLAVALFVTLCSAMSWSTGYSGLGNPIGPSTVPPSSMGDGLVDNPNPIDMTGNLLITGNVRRGRYFRGDVPYRSTTSFGSVLGSSSLSSFLRDSAGSEDFGRYYSTYINQPYYFPTETVPTTIPGRAGVFRPASTRIGTSAQDVFGLEPLPKTQSGQGTAVSDLTLPGPQTQYDTSADLGELSRAEPRSMSLTPRPSETGLRREGQKSVVERFREQVEDSRVLLRSEPEQELSDIGQPPRTEDDASLRLLREDQVSTRAQQVDLNPIGRREAEPKMQPPVRPTTDREQAAAAPYRLPALGESAPSTESTLQRNIMLQQPSDLSAAGTESKAARQRPASETLEQILARYKADERGELETGSSLTDTGKGQEPSDALERIKQQLDGLTMSIEKRLQAEKDDALDGRGTELLTKQEKTPSAAQRYASDLNKTVGVYNIEGVDPSVVGADELAPATPGDELSPAADGKEKTRTVPVGRTLMADPYQMVDYDVPQKKSPPLAELKELSRSELSAEAKRIMGPHQSLESLSEAKFTQHMLAAEDHLKAGRYYRAASCFGLASMYRPDNSQALAGRGHALFAAGEYVSSALFLARALAVAPDYAQTKIDFVAAVGGAERLAGRVADVEQWLARSGSGELQFLLGYVYYRTGKLTQAKQAIDTAYEKMPNSPAVKALRTSIYRATQGR